MSIYIYIYICLYIYVCIYMYVYIYIYVFLRWTYDLNVQIVKLYSHVVLSISIDIRSQRILSSFSPSAPILFTPCWITISMKCGEKTASHQQQITALPCGKITGHRNS